MTSGRVLYVQYGNPAAYPPIERAARHAADAGRDVVCLGVRTAGVEELQMAPHARISVRLLDGGGSGWRLRLHYAWFCLWVAWQAQRERPAVVYASDIMSALPALWLTRAGAYRVIYHEHDTYEATRPTAFMRICLAARRRLSRLSALNVLPHDGRVERFRQDTGAPAQRCRRAWNCPALAEVSGPPKRHAKAEAGPDDPPGADLRLLYHGSISPRHLPLAVLRALATVPGVRLRIIGYETIGSRGYIAQLQAEAERLRLTDRVEFLGPMSHHLLRAFSEDCDVGLSFMPMDDQSVNERFMAGASVKAFEYLAHGLPLLVSDLEEWRTLYMQAGVALCCNPEDPASVAAAISRYLDDPMLTSEMGERGRLRVLEQWNFETEHAPVLRAMLAEASA